MNSKYKFKKITSSNQNVLQNEVASIRANGINVNDITSTPSKKFFPIISVA
jgi:hypothetical protein